MLLPDFGWSVWIFSPSPRSLAGGHGGAEIHLHCAVSLHTDTGLWQRMPVIWLRAGQCFAGSGSVLPAGTGCRASTGSPAVAGVMPDLSAASEYPERYVRLQFTVHPDSPSSAALVASKGVATIALLCARDDSAGLTCGEQCRCWHVTVSRASGGSWPSNHDDPRDSGRDELPVGGGPLPKILLRAIGPLARYGPSLGLMACSAQFVRQSAGTSRFSSPCWSRASAARSRLGGIQCRSAERWLALVSRRDLPLVAATLPGTPHRTFLP